MEPHRLRHARPSLDELSAVLNVLALGSRAVDEPALERYRDALASTPTTGGYLVGRMTTPSALEAR